MMFLEGGGRRLCNGVFTLKQSDLLGGRMGMLFNLEQPECVWKGGGMVFYP